MPVSYDPISSIRRWAANNAYRLKRVDAKKRAALVKRDTWWWPQWVKLPGGIKDVKDWDCRHDK